MARRTRLSKEDIQYPIPANFKLNAVSNNIDDNPKVQRQIIRQAIRAAYSKNESDGWGYNEEDKKIAVQAVTDDQVDLVTAIMQSLQPTDAVEAILAAQFAVSYIRGMKDINGCYGRKDAFEALQFGHTVLGIFQKYRTKGAQQIQVQYNVNQGQVVNIKSEVP